MLNLLLGVLFCFFNGKSFCLFFSSLKDLKKRNILGYLVLCPSFSSLKLSFNHSKVEQPGPKTHLGITQGRSRAPILPSHCLELHTVGQALPCTPKHWHWVFYTQSFMLSASTLVSESTRAPQNWLASTRGAGSIAKGRLIRCAGTKQACTAPDT